MAGIMWEQGLVVLHGAHGSLTKLDDIGRVCFFADGLPLFVNYKDGRFPALKLTHREVSGALSKGIDILTRAAVGLYSASYVSKGLGLLHEQ